MRNFAAFALMSLIWGLTWAAIKIGLSEAPPLLFAAIRYLVAAALLVFTLRDSVALFTDGRAGRTMVSALFTVGATQGLLLWGMQHVASGLAGLVNLALIPVMLFALAAATREERAGWRHALALLIGCAGLTGLFWTRLGESRSNGLGLIAIVVATACYCGGSVIARPLLGVIRPLTLTFAQAAIGGTALLALSLVTEPVAVGVVARLASPKVLASLTFLSVLGTIVAFTLYLVLLRDWGTVRAGLYAFISPIIALMAGAALFGEPVGWAEVGGAILLLAAAAIALARPLEPDRS